MIIWKLNTKPIFPPALFVEDLKRNELKLVPFVLAKAEDLKISVYMLIKSVSIAVLPLLFHFGVRSKAEELSALKNVRINTYRL